jgi:hypothetical protein
MSVRGPGAGRLHRAILGVVTAAVLGLLGPAGLLGQATPQGCRFRIDHVGGEGRQVVIGADTNYYAGRGVEISCVGTSIRMSSDSVAFYGRGRNTLVEFLGRVKYRDSTVTMDADRGTYYRNGERWEARGHVRTENVTNGSTLEGPMLDYLRAVPGVRDSIELWAVGRPTIRSFPRDSTGQRGEPYVVVADRVRMRGNDRMWAGGKVTVDRSDFQARGDSLYLDTGTGSRGELIGSPVLRGTGRDSFELTGTRIELQLDQSAITYVIALGQAHAVSSEVDLVADTIGLDLENEELEHTIAWGDSTRPRGVTRDYEILGDSLAFDTPGRVLKEVRAFGRAWVGGKPDSTTGERDWMSGDTVVAYFTTWDSAGTAVSALDQLDARGGARSYYRVESRRPGVVLPSINYAKGERITVQMKSGGRRGVDRVNIWGQVDGVHLEPVALRPDTAAADTTRREGRP